MANNEPNTFADLAGELLEAAASCLDLYSPEGAPGLQFLSHGDPINPGCPYLAVWSTPIAPTSPFPRPAGLLAGCDEITWSIQFHLKLRRCNYPTLSKASGTAKLPDPAEVNQAATRQLIDGRILSCCIPQQWAAGELFRDPTKPDSMPADLVRMQVVWGAITAVRQANVAGWDWPMQVAVPVCCPIPEFEPELPPD